MGPSLLRFLAPTSPQPLADIQPGVGPRPSVLPPEPGYFGSPLQMFVSDPTVSAQARQDWTPAALPSPDLSYQGPRDPMALTSLIGSFGDVAADMHPGMRGGAFLDDVLGAGMTVYHGTPHRFAPTSKNPLGEFDPTKIGSGEGAQAFGYGHYFAENPAVARSYQRDLAGKQAFLRGEPVTDWKTPERRIAHEMSYHMDEGMAANQGVSAEKAKEYVVDKWQHHVDYLKGELEAIGEAEVDPGWGELAKPSFARQMIEKELAEALPYLDAAKRLNAADVEYKPAGHMLEIDLPDEQIEKMLDYDAPLKDQPAEVREALLNMKRKPRPIEEMETEEIRDVLRSIDPNGNYDYWEDAPDVRLDRDDLLEMADYMRMEDPEGWDNYMKGGAFLPDQEGAGILRQLENEMGSREAAAQALRDAGIPGLKFFDATSRKGQEGTRNIVVFPGGEDLLNITGRR